MNRLRLLLALALPLAGCDGDASTIEGSLLDGVATGWVWVEGEAERTPIDGDRFRLDAVSGDTVFLHFADGEDQLGRMRIIGLAGGSQLTLHGVWFDDGTAFPSSIEGGEGRLVEINRLRMGEWDAGEVEVAGTVLAMGGNDDALIVRPHDAERPDVRVIVTPATGVVGEDDEPARLSRLEFGDTLRVRGVVESGYLVAGEVVLPRSVAAGRSAEEESDSDGPRLLGVPVTPSASPPSAPPAAEPPGRGDDDRPGNRGRGRGRGNRN